ETFRVVPSDLGDPFEGRFVDTCKNSFDSGWVSNQEDRTARNRGLLIDCDRSRVALRQIDRCQPEVKVLAQALYAERHWPFVPGKISRHRHDGWLESIAGDRDRRRVVPPRFEYVVIGEDMTGAIDQKAASKYVQVNGPAAAFSGDSDISPAIGDRIAVRVDTGKHQPRTTRLIPTNHY